MTLQGSAARFRVCRVVKNGVFASFCSRKVSPTAVLSSFTAAKAEKVAAADAIGRSQLLRLWVFRALLFDVGRYRAMYSAVAFAIWQAQKFGPLFAKLRGVCPCLP